MLTHLEQLIKGLLHAAIAVNRKLVIDWVAAEDLEPRLKESDLVKWAAARELIEGADGLLVPGGFAPHWSDALGDEGERIIKQIVSSGGGYVGLCAGAYYGVWSGLLPAEIVDIDGDGYLDVLVLATQGHNELVPYLGRGGRRFERPLH